MRTLGLWGAVLLALAPGTSARGGGLAEEQATGPAAQDREDVESAPVPGGLLVASRGSDKVLLYDRSGASQGVFASDPLLVKPVGVTYGPDGNVYVAVGDSNRVMKFDGKTGGSLGVFTSGVTIESPRNVNFGPDGAFYVADGFLSQILKFDGKTGDFERIFIQDPSLNGPTSFTFGPGGDVFVVSVLTNRVLRFDGETGALMGPFATTALAQPHDVSFGPDGNLYVTNSGSGIVQRFRGDTGEYIGPFVNDPALHQPLGMAWGLDGNLYVANQGGNEVRRYAGSTGAGLGVLVAPGAGGLAMPAFFVFVPPAKLTLSVKPDPAPDTLRLAVSGARPGAKVLLVQGSSGGSATFRDCPKLRLPIKGASIADTRIADESGNTVAVLAGTAGTKLSLVAIDAARCLATKPVIATVP
jgi:DNA-binding beta-propeller fold protein YncE